MTVEQDQKPPEDANVSGDADREMTDDELAEAKQYGRIELACDLVDRAIDLVVLSVLAFALAVPFDGWLERFGPLAERAWLRLLALYLVVYFVHLSVSFPLSFYSGYILEHRFDLSNLTIAGWLRRFATRNGLAVIFGGLMFLGLYALIWTTGPWWWLASAAAFFVVSVALQQLLPVLFPLFMYKMERLEDEALRARLERLAEGTGLAVEGVYRMLMSAETKKANAMLAGVGRTRRVVLGDTLLANFTPEEIEVIFAHELGHHVHRHLPKYLLAGVVYCLVGFWVCDLVLQTYVGGVAYAEMPVYTLPLLMLSITVLSQLVEPLQNAVSRWAERQADRYALARTGRRNAYVSAFRKLSKINKDDPNPHPLEVFLFHSHPPISERLAIAEQ